MGLPRTGKTTFLAALWQVVASNEITAGLRLKELFGDDEHLNTIRRQWLSCEEFERTKLGSEKVVTMRLHEPESNSTADIVFPDLSGETFQQQWEYRQWTVEYANLVRDAVGAILFLHPDKVNRQASILEVNAAVAEIDDIFDGKHNENGESDQDISEAREEHPTRSQIRADEGGSDSSTIEWDAKYSATQTQLVELLQFISNEELQRCPFRIAIVVSAWDKLRSLNMSPSVWVRSELPFLDQFLTANGETFEHRIYGVSAQGGDLKEDISMLTKFVQHTQRIEVVGQDVPDHDLTGIVKWVMS